MGFGSKRELMIALYWTFACTTAKQGRMGVYMGFTLIAAGEGRGSGRGQRQPYSARRKSARAFCSLAAGASPTTAPTADVSQRNISPDAALLLWKRQAVLRVYENVEFNNQTSLANRTSMATP